MIKLFLLVLYFDMLLIPAYSTDCIVSHENDVGPASSVECPRGQNFCLRGTGHIYVFGEISINFTLYSCASYSMCNSSCEEILRVDGGHVLWNLEYYDPFDFYALGSCTIVCCEGNNCNNNPIDQIIPFEETLPSSSVQTATTPMDEEEDNCGTSYYTRCYGERIDCAGDFKECYGDDNHCSGDYNDCYGERNNCSGEYNECYGDGGECSGDYSTCYGNNKNCTGSFSTCFGDNINCTGDYSKCFGNNINCHGQFSNCYGNNVNCYGDFSSCNGNRVSCSGRFSNCP